MLPSLQHLMFLDFNHVHSNGTKRILVCATDTNILILAIVTTISTENWLAFGHSANFQYNGVHDNASEFGNEYYMIFQDVTPCLP